jgi:diguanylate cyclase (GGDEF)-like protein
MEEIIMRSAEKPNARSANLKALNELREKELAGHNQADETLRQRAFYDKLTGLPNRVMFLEELKRASSYKKRNRDYLFAVCYVDLDRFKVIDDNYGHDIGDKLLISTAERLKSCIRESDIAARFEGDRFAVLLEDIESLTDATRVADRIQEKMSVPFIMGELEVSVTASIGIASSTTGYGSEENILRDADSAMYRAKSMGRARYEMFDTALLDKAKKLSRMETELRRACDRNEFLVYYQPIVSMTDIRIVGAEALVRWQHPERGLVPPMEFIPLAEETGLIFKIGEIVMREACAQNRAWQDAGYQKLLMGLNFVPGHFLSGHFIDMIKSLLEETGMDAQFLNVEITERTAMKEHCISVLNELSSMGAKTSIDDFGTGYSSLASLKLFPIDTLKIDMSFVRDITKDSNADAIVTAITAMAHSLRLKVVAEGVETKEQLDFLDSQLCDEVQGFYYSRPVPAGEFTGLLEKGVYQPSEIPESIKSV